MSYFIEAHQAWGCSETGPAQEEESRPQSLPLPSGLGLLEPHTLALRALALAVLQVGNLMAQTRECLIQGHALGKRQPKSGSRLSGSSQGFLVFLFMPLPSQYQASS